MKGKEVENGPGWMKTKEHGGPFGRIQVGKWSMVGSVFREVAGEESWGPDRSL